MHSDQIEVNIIINVPTEGLKNRHANENGVSGIHTAKTSLIAHQSLGTHSGS